MTIPIYKKSEKILFLFFTTVFVALSLYFGYCIVFGYKNNWDYVLFIGFSFLSIISFIVTFNAFRCKAILNDNGITFLTVFKQQLYNWSDIKFAAEYDIIIRVTNTKGVIISFDIEKEDITYSHFAKGFDKKHFICLPYSEEIKECFISYLPYKKYLGLTFTNESLNK